MNAPAQDATQAGDREPIRYVDDEAGVLACFPLMHQLRPHLASPEEFVARWRRQVAAGYRLLALWQGGRPVALAGFRLLDNLVHGVHFYVDDLVTDESARSGGYGHLLMNRLKDEARALGCAKLVLDTPLTNVLGHRFYYRNGLLASALRFNIALA
ncbi:GNAT family N-acetyltransferase [Cupriavidus basilensis]|uniref:GNAT family N-acetyltransferase n=1 Tax=Cupriavidus sp. SK-3 TaxID=1470558 RepID=UPI0004457449|nr:GNAT family N-acetyltransferase [Cupriavidus sp. SK-3]KDP84182.1 GCN5 family acetyltransferase [Cupriavidus sp. SK-3]